MRIAFLGTRGVPSSYSGYEVFAEELGWRLAARGHEVTVYAHRGLFPERRETYRGMRLRYVPSLRGKNTEQLSHSLLCSLRAAVSDAEVVLFCNAANGPFGAVLRLFGKPCAINVDGLEWLRPKWGALARRVFRFGAWCSTRLFDVVVTDALGMQEVYRREFGCESVAIAYGADLKHPEDPGRVRALGLEPGEYYLILSRLIPDNNADTIVRGFVRSGTRRRLAVAGGTPYRNPYEDEVREAADSRVVFLGQVHGFDLVHELFCNAFAYLHGHEFGGTNPSLLKALACGSPVAALDTPFSREVLDDGACGVLFAKDPEDVRRAVERLESEPDLAPRLRERARQRIVERYTWEAITDQYEALFRRMLAPGAAGPLPPAAG